MYYIRSFKLGIFFKINNETQMAFRIGLGVVTLKKCHLFCNKCPTENYNVLKIFNYL